MKKLFFIITTNLVLLVNAQHSIQPNFGNNLWMYGSGYGSSGITSYIELGAQYEYALNNNLGLDAGFSINIGSSGYGGVFSQISFGGRYNFNQLNDGFFAGALLGIGFSDGANLIEFGPNFGYSLPLGPGSLNPSIGLGYLSWGADGYRFGGIHMPFNVSYSYSF